MPTAKTFEELEIWKLARELENKIWILTNQSTLSKDFDLKNQMNRSSGSIMDNIAEGFGRRSRLEFINFLTISNGSCEELKSQLYRCLDRKHIDTKDFDVVFELAEKTTRKINALIIYLNKTDIKGSKFKDRTNEKQ